jgi:hypothetical protein
MQDIKTLPQAIRDDDPSTAPDATKFAGPLIATAQGAMWSAALDPATGEPIDSLNLNNDIPAASRGLIAAAALYGKSQNPSNETWRRIASLSVSGDVTGTSFSTFTGIATVTNLVYADPENSGDFIQAELADLLSDGQDFTFDPGAGVGLTQAFGMGFTGVTGEYDRHRVASATNIATFRSKGAPLVTPPGEWTINSEPAANTTATATRAAGGAGVRHVLKSINASLIGVAAIAAPISVVVRDGATGVGAILWSDKLFAAAAGSRDRVTLVGLNIVGTANTAMTVEFTAGPGATNFEVLSATGYDAPG